MELGPLAEGWVSMFCEIEAAKLGALSVALKSQSSGNVTCRSTFLQFMQGNRGGRRELVAS